MDKMNSGDYYFSDSYHTSEDEFPDLARAEAGRDKAPTPEWVKYVESE